MNNERKIIDSVETLEAALASLKEAEKKFSTYTQEIKSSLLPLPPQTRREYRLQKWRLRRPAWA